MGILYAQVNINILASNHLIFVLVARVGVFVSGLSAEALRIANQQAFSTKLD